MRSFNADIDITYNCNLACKWCNRLCGTEFNCAEHMMTFEQYSKYIDIILPYVTRESEIRLLGGEPTLHPQFLPFLELAITKIRPRMIRPILLFTDGVGKKVTTVLDQVRANFITATHMESEYGVRKFLLPKHFPSAQVIIVQSKTDPAFVLRQHYPITRALQDFDYLEKTFKLNKCRNYVKNGYGITPYGIYICSACTTLARIYRLGNGFDHVPTDEETTAQSQRMCKFCWEPCSDIRGMPVSRTYERYIEEWRKDPYFLPVLKLSSESEAT